MVITGSRALHVNDIFKITAFTSAQASYRGEMSGLCAIWSEKAENICEQQRQQRNKINDGVNTISLDLIKLQREK